MEGGLNLAAMSSGEGGVGEFDGLSELWQINLLTVRNGKSIYKSPCF